MNVIQVWEHVLKWGIAQNPGLSSDPSSYSKDDFITLKNTLQRFVPFIKFFNLNHKEFLNKVYPYKKIIPKDLRENLIKHFIDQPNHKPESTIITKEIIGSKSIDSRIITFQHAELISKWIDSKFHEICDYQSHTISIIKVKDSNEILGGYNPIIWKSDSSVGATKDSFIFSFKNKENIEENILSRVESNGSNAIRNDPDFGPVFGGYEFILNENDSSGSVQDQVYYDKSIREIDDFSVEEFEVFQIMKD
ncbi:hypothetical protein RirG_113160 [Rhizophagus irregularis DAOM 197198w]|uniref:TLDc domain-containing protein n=2 Tax=Rhizophagus irregularis TaxID=588596 RepID=A0A015KJ09_RHIIW|nr:hypothetical protein RirG_113160 [Rhizophagus irregularis DAOM 197198w]